MGSSGHRPQQHDGLIELDAERAGPDPDSPPPGRRVGRPLTVLLLGFALLVTMAGSAPPPPPVLTQVFGGSVALEQNYLLTGDRLVVAVASLDAPELWVHVHELRTGRQVWSRTYPASAHLPTQRGPGIQEADGLLLLTLGGPPAGSGWTIAVDADTGQPRWDLPNVVSLLSDRRTGLISGWIETARQPVTDAGVVVGHSHSLHVSLRTIDLASRTVLWQSPPLTDYEILMTAPGADPELRVVTTAGVNEIRAARSGATIRSYPLGVGGASGAAPPEPGPVIIARHGQSVEVDPQSGHPLRALDPISGETQFTLTEWTDLAWSAPYAAQPLLLTRPSPDPPGTWLGLLEAGAPAVRLLGLVAHRNARCQVTVGYVACQSDEDGLAVWRYRP